MNERPLVQNAADARQVKIAGRAEAREREDELNDWRAVLGTESGRRLLWRILVQCRVFGSVFDPSAEKMAFNAGRQDVGHFVMGEISEADEQKLLLMMQESQAREAKRKQTNDATHTASALERSQETTE